MELFVPKIGSYDDNWLTLSSPSQATSSSPMTLPLLHVRQLITAACKVSARTGANSPAQGGDYEVTINIRGRALLESMKLGTVALCDYTGSRIAASRKPKVPLPAVAS
jgi:hypothetical protein